MALSNYLGHTVVGIPVFYSVGLGMGPRYGMVAVVCTKTIERNLDRCSSSGNDKP